MGGHEGYSMFPRELEGKASSLPYDAKDVIESLHRLMIEGRKT